MFTFVVGTWLFQPTRRVPGTKILCYVFSYSCSNKENGRWAC